MAQHANLNNRNGSYPHEALQQALRCLDSAHESLKGERTERADEVIALLSAAAAHLEEAWERKTNPTDIRLTGAE